MANFLKTGLSQSSRTDWAMEKARPLTPRSDRLRSSYGSLEMSLQAVRGLCSAPRCIRKEGHTGACWPKPPSRHGVRLHEEG